MEICVSEPERVLEGHAAWIAAGAQVVRTRSFGANAVSLAAHRLEHRVSEINWAAAQIAREAVRGTGCFVAGCVGPLDLTSARAAEQGIDRREVFSEQMGALMDGGARLILLEGFSDLGEMLLALEVKHSLHHCPVICSLLVDETGVLPDGTNFDRASATLIDAGADVIGINLAGRWDSGQRTFDKVSSEHLTAIFAGVGAPGISLTPEAFAEFAVRLARRGARLIGGGAGLEPRHLSVMVAALREAGL